MKALITGATAALASFSAASAFGVTMARCPTTLHIRIKNLEPASDASLKKQAEEHSGELKDLIAARAEVARANIPGHAYTLNLSRKSNSECGYHASWQPKNPENETRLFTRNGRDILRFSIGMKPAWPVWTYFNVLSYQTSGITVEKSGRAAPVLAIFDHGSPKYAVAWVLDSVVR